MAEFKIPFNKPYLSGKELDYIQDAVARGHISGNGYYTKKCQKFLEDRLESPLVLLTTSCTDALEMCAILADIRPGDEVIMPSFTFVSTALAFVRQGAVIKFIDSRDDHPGMNEKEIERHITPRTRAIVAVHYAGIACDMDEILHVAKKHHLLVIEDAAQAVDSYFKERPLGTLGHLAAFSFHETKNIQCGEGGALVVNDARYRERAEIIWEKGTNRKKFLLGLVDKYNWVDTGSSFLPSDMIAAYLWAQLECLTDIQQKRRQILNQYFKLLAPAVSPGTFKMPTVPSYASQNAHMLYLVADSEARRINTLAALAKESILGVFHYQALHHSDFFLAGHQKQNLPYAEQYSARLFRLPLYIGLTEQDVANIVKTITGLVERT